MKLNFAYSIFVGLLNTIYTVAFRSKDIAIESKTVGRPFNSSNLCSKSVRWYFFVRIIVLKYVANSTKSLKVLILIRIHVVQGIWI